MLNSISRTTALAAKHVDDDRGTPFSRCVSELAKGLRASAKKSKSDRRQARIACRRPDFEGGKEFNRCVRVLTKALRRF